MTSVERRAPATGASPCTVLRAELKGTHPSERGWASTISCFGSSKFGTEPEVLSSMEAIACDHVRPCIHGCYSATPRQLERCGWRIFRLCWNERSVPELRPLSLRWQRQGKRGMKRGDSDARAAVRVEFGTPNAKSLCGVEGRIDCRQTLLTAVALR